MKVTCSLKWLVVASILFFVSGPATAQSKFFGEVSTAPSPVRVAGFDTFTIQAPAGGFSAEERTVIVERNINNALIACRDRSPKSVSVVTINGLPVIRLGGFHIVTIDSNSANIAGIPPAALAEAWSADLRQALLDKDRVDNYICQLNGDYLVTPYSIPTRQVQFEAARKNHAAFQYREDLSPGTLTSQAYADRGMKELNSKRDLLNAQVLFRKALDACAENIRARYGLALCLLKEGRTDEAVSELQIARTIDPDNASVHIALGEAFECQGRDLQAVKQYQEAALLQPENPIPVLYIADIREQRDDIGKSVRELTAAEKRMPDSQFIELRKRDQVAYRLLAPM